MSSLSVGDSTHKDRTRQEGNKHREGKERENREGQEGEDRSAPASSSRVAPRRLGICSLEAVPAAQACGGLPPRAARAGQAGG